MDNRDKWHSVSLRLPEISEELDRLFNELILQPWGLEDVEIHSPSVDFYETPDALVLEADLPGMKADEVRVDVEEDELVLRGLRVVEHQERSGRFYHRERRAGYFVRRISLPEWVDQDGIRVEFDDGVLRVTLPKSQGGAP